MTYIITGSCNGVPYYLNVDDDVKAFVWEGLINNATVFYNWKDADTCCVAFHERSKLPMEIIPYTPKS